MLMLDIAVLVISILVGLGLMLMFVYKLWIEETFDQAAQACLLGGLALFGISALGFWHSSVDAKTYQAKIAALQTRIDELNETATKVDAKAETAMTTANKALAAAQTAKDRVAIAPGIQHLQTQVASLKQDLKSSATQGPNGQDNKRNGSLERNVKQLKRAH